MSDNYAYCILSDEKDIIQFEKALFKAFSQRSPEGWISKNYEVIDNCRFKPKGLTYNDLKIYSIKKTDSVISGSAINFNHNNFLFIEKGFKLNNTEKEMKIVEGLNMFVDEDIKGEEAIRLTFGLFDFVFNELKKEGINTMYGTCYKKLKASYYLLDWELIDTKDVNGQEMFFFQYCIK